MAGFLTGLVVLLFRAALEGGAWLTGRENAESFDGLSPWAYLLMPLFGAIVLGIILNRLPADSRRFGVVHVMERLSRYQGHMPLRAALYQFFGGVAALTTGLSGGREGPAVHLGAATSSLLGDAFRLPNNSVRTLVACGSAAAIGASFNTPMAGVIFAMEVVMMEYTIASFIPVILAAVTATVVNRWFFGDVSAFSVPETELRSLLEIPYITLAGIAVGAVGAVFIVLVKTVARFQTGPLWLRTAIAGAVTGCAAMAAPAVLGVGYDTVNHALLGELAWTALAIILVAKTIASAACVGVGLPVGMIGPTLVMGALLGGLLGEVGNAFAPGYASEPALYVMLGMAAMMAAVLQAPLAALLAVLELTGNPAIILTGHAHHRRGLADGQSAREAALHLPNHAVRPRPAIPARPGFAAPHARRCGRLDDASRCAQAEVCHRQRPAHGARRFAELDRDRRGRYFPRRIERRRP